MEIMIIKGNSILVKGKKESLLIDPAEELLDNSKYPARIIAFSKNGELHWQSESEGRVVLTGPGEYEVGGVEINGYSTPEGSTIYTAVIDGVTVGFIGGIKEMLTDKKIEKIGGLDVLVYSIGSDSEIDGKDVLALAKRLGANYLIPCGYQPDSDLFKKFLDETDNEGLESTSSLKVDRDSLPDGLEVVAIWTK